MSNPITVGVDGPFFVTERSALVTTFVGAVELSFAGWRAAVGLVTFAVFEIDPVAPELTATVRVKEDDEPAVSVAMEQFTVAPVVQLNAGPLFWTSETKVVFAGSVSASATEE